MRSYLQIDLKILKDNIRYIQSSTHKDIIAVVKSNAYGHGLIEVASLLSHLNVKMFAVATLEEAIQLRKNLISTSILLLERTNEYHILNSFKITPAVYSLDQLQELSKSHYALPFHLKIDTGLNRLGIRESEIDSAKEIIKKSNLILKGIFTHYNEADDISSSRELFKRCLTKFTEYPNLIIHSQSSKYLNENHVETNAVRPGLALYGLLEGYPTKPFLELYAPIYQVKHLNKGELVGYLNKGVMPKDGYLLTIPLGYADGWERNRKTLGFANEEFLPQVGLTCMDSLMLFSNQQIENKTLIEIIGPHFKVIELSKLYSITPYELVSTLSYRLKRIYKK